MSSLVNRIQRAILGSSGPEELHSLLVELAIPGGQPRKDDAFKRVRRAILYSGASESELRSAFADLGLSGGGDDPVGGLRNIRRAILYNL